MAAARPWHDARVWYVTTARRPDAALESRARELADRLGLPYRRRPEGRLSDGDRGRAGEEGRAEAYLVVERTGLAIQAAGRRLVYHPGMAVHRIRALRAGGGDPMVEAMGLRGGERVLDATLGLASDALVAAYAIGPRGRVSGVEKVPALAELVREGLARFAWRDPDMAQAAARIDVHVADHGAYLAGCSSGAFDVVYFDAMFERSLSGSTTMAAWRLVAEEGPVGERALVEAMRVARRRVVLKDRADSARLGALTPHRVAGGRSSRVVYGIWVVGPDAGDG